MKTKKIFKKTVKYLRELSIVVIGVAITVSIGLWMNKKSNEKDLKQYLSAIKMELEENAEKIDRYIQWLQKSVRYADYLKLNDKKSLNKDTLIYYAHTNDQGLGCYYMHSPKVFTANVFETFKLSGFMRQMNNKELLKTIWGAYTKMENTQIYLDMSFQTRKEEAMKYMQLIAEGKPIDVPMQIFFSTDLPYTMVDECRQASETLKETISKLEKAL